jgi:cellobiose phosphorylase
LKAAVLYTFKNTGQKQMPKMGFADWNDTLHINGPKPGVSVWVAQFLAKTSRDLAEAAELIGKKADAKIFRKIADTMAERVNKNAWDGAWYIRAWNGWGEPLGSKSCQEGKMHLNSQSWSVISGVADAKRGRKAMDSVRKHLDSDYGVALVWPAYRHFNKRMGGVSTFPTGLKENGAIFCHANTWVIIAEAMLGRGEYAMKYYKQLTPPVKDRMQDVHKAEPYVYSQSIASKEHRDYGLARNSWLSGTASWMFVAATQYLLGIRPTYKGLIVDPCIPSDWEGFEVTRIFRGTKYHIVVKNPKGVSKGVVGMLVNGKAVKGNVIPSRKAKDVQEVEVMLG